MKALVLGLVLLGLLPATRAHADASRPAGRSLPTGRASVEKRPIEAMIAIPAGTFTMGADEPAQKAAIELCKEEMGSQARGCRSELVLDEQPARRVWLSGFSIDRVEVTVRAYRVCVEAGVCSPEPLLQADPRFVQPELPVSAVTFPEAERYCAWRGARLPTEAEWERAARGRDGRIWPWGHLASPGASNHGKIQVLGELSPTPYPVMQPDASDGYAWLAPVGSYPQGASPEGVLDLAGNVLEWTADGWAEEPPQRRSTVNPRGPTASGQRVVRGGSWRQPRMFQRTTSREGLPPDLRAPEIGFRCAR